MPPSPPEWARIASTSRRARASMRASAAALARRRGQQRRRQRLVRRRIGRRRRPAAACSAASRRSRLIAGLLGPRLTDVPVYQRRRRPHCLPRRQTAIRDAHANSRALCRRDARAAVLLALSCGMFFAEQRNTTSARMRPAAPTADDPRDSDMNDRSRSLRLGRTRSSRRGRAARRPPRPRADRDQILARLQVRRPGRAVPGRDRQGLLQGRRPRRHHRHRGAARSSRSTASPPAPTTWASATSTR